MTKILPSVIVIFTILSLACVLSAHVDNPESKNDDSQKDSAASPKNHSSGRIIRPSAWSKEEERELKPGNGRNTGNEYSDLLLFDEQFSLLDIKKFFRYIMSLLYVVDESNDRSWKEAINDVVLKMQNLRSNGPQVKSENNGNGEMKNFQKDEAQDKSADDKQFQNSSTSDTPNKLSDSGMMQNLPNNGSLNSRRSAKTPKFETQNVADIQDDGEMQNSPSNNPSNKPSKDGNAQKSNKNKQPTRKPRLGIQNSINKDSTEGSENNMKTQTQNLASTDIQDNGEIENFPNNDLNKSSNDENSQKTSLKLSFNNKQQTKNSKQATQNCNDKNSMNKSENKMETKAQNLASTDNQDTGKMQNSPPNNALNKPSNNGNVQKFPDNDSSNKKQPTENPELETQNYNDKDSTNNSKNNMKTESQNPDESNTPTKSKTGEEIQNFSTNDSLNKPSDNETIQNSSNNKSSNSWQPTKNLEDSQQNSMNKDNLNKTTQNTTMRNPSNNNNQLKSISALKNDEPKENWTVTVFKDYDENKTGEVTLDDNTTEYISEKKVEKYEDNDKEEEDYENDRDENDMNENEAENDYINDGTDINENDMKENDIENGNENDMNENDSDGNNLNENNYDGDKNKPETGDQNSQPAVIGQEKADDRPITLPKFIRNYSETHPLKNQIDNNGNATSESVKSQNIPNEDNPSPEFQLSSNEFIDDYINNRQRQNPQRGNEQARNMKAFNPNGSNTRNKKQILPVPIYLNKLKKDYMPLNAAPSISETMKHRNMPFHQSQITKDSFWPETNALPTFNVDRKGSNRNEDLPDKTFPQHLPHTFTSVDKPVFVTQENMKIEEDTPQKLIPYQQTPYFTDLQDTFIPAQTDYNTFTQPAILEFQDTTPSVQTFHSDVPATDEYRPKITSSFQTYPDKPVPLQNEGYLNDQHGNYNFQDGKTPAINNQQFEQTKPPVLQPGKFSSTQYISNQISPDELDKITYFTNYKTEMPDNLPNVEKLEPNTEMFSNHMISDVLQPNPSFNQIYNQDSSPTGAENNMDKNIPQDQFDVTKSQNQTNNGQTLNPQNQSENQPLQDKPPEEQMLFPDNDKSLQQNEMNNRTSPDKSKMSLDRFPAKDETENAELPLSENNTKNSKEVPRHTFNITEDNVQVKPENQDSPSVIPQNVPKSQSPQPKARFSKSLIDERQKSPTFDQAEDQEEEISSSGSNSSKNEIENDYVSENNYDSEDKTNEDKNQDDEDKEEDDDYDDYDDDDDDDDDDEIEDNYISDNKFDRNDSRKEDGDEDKDENEEKEKDENKDDYEEEEKDEDKDDYVMENKYDHDETEASRNSENTETTVVINEETRGSATISPNFVNQVQSHEQNHSITQPPTSHDNIISEPSKSHSITNKENPSSVFELSNDGLNDNYNNDFLGESSIKGKEPTSLSDGTINDATMQITQNPTYGDTNDVAQSSIISKSELASSNQEGSFDTILEYVYKYSNNSLFKGIREEKN